MQIQRCTAAIPFPSQEQTYGNQTISNDTFAALIGQLKDVEKPGESKHPAAIPEITPQQLFYHQNRSASNVVESSIIDGLLWNDKKFAYLSNSHATLSTEQKINWQATGSKSLTEDQIAMLKEKYDIENMSAQDSYNLMSDLTNFNVISAKDCISTKVKTFPFSTTRVLFCDSTIDFSKPLSHSQGNLLTAMQMECERYAQLWDWVHNKDFDSVHSLMTPKEKQEGIDIIADEMNSYNRLYQIYQRIKR